MAINRDPVEWFERHDRMDEVVYGILEAKDWWFVLKKDPNGHTKGTRVSEVARAPDRKTAIGFIKLLVEK